MQKRKTPHTYKHTKFSLGKRDPNPYWFNMEIFAVIASNSLKIRQVFSAAFSLYQQKSLKLNCSHLPMRCFSQDFSAEGCRQADACQIRQAERLQKYPSPGNACSSPVCLRQLCLFPRLCNLMRQGTRSQRADTVQCPIFEALEFAFLKINEFDISKKRQILKLFASDLNHF